MAAIWVARTLQPTKLVLVKGSDVACVRLARILISISADALEMDKSSSTKQEAQRYAVVPCDKAGKRRPYESHGIVSQVLSRLVPYASSFLFMTQVHDCSTQIS
jgi:hypothetical protein